MAMLGLKPMQVESTLLHMIREGMGGEGRKIGDIYIDPREQLSSTNTRGSPSR